MARLEISRPCNLGCIMCARGINPYNARREGAPFLTLDHVQRLDQLLPDLLWVIAVGLGEPFLNPEFVPILRHVRRLNEEVHLFTSTNGTVLSDTSIEAIVDERLVSELQISLDGAQRGTFEAIRPRASYD